MQTLKPDPTLGPQPWPPSLDKLPTIEDRPALAMQREEDMRRDPWAHRSQGMQCATCMWYAHKISKATLSKVGRCRRHAPTMSGYPVVFNTDWCGDHKLNENAVV